MPLGMTFSLLAMLALLVACTYNALHCDSRFDHTSFIWGGAVMVGIYAILAEVPGPSTKVTEIIHDVTHLLDFIPNPEWWNQQWSPVIFWAVVGVAGYFFATKVLHIRLPWMSDRPAPARTGAARRGRGRVGNRRPAARRGGSDELAA